MLTRPRRAPGPSLYGPEAPLRNRIVADLAESEPYPRGRLQSLFSSTLYSLLLRDYTTNTMKREDAKTSAQTARVLDQMYRQERSYRSRIQAALFRARAHGGAKAAEEIAPDRYRVVGLRGTYYVALFGLETSRCTCTAGSYGHPCYHAACAFLKKVADGMVAA